MFRKAMPDEGESEGKKGIICKAFKRKVHILEELLKNSNISFALKNAIF